MPILRQIVSHGGWRRTMIRRDQDGLVCVLSQLPIGQGSDGRARYNDAELQCVLRLEQSRPR